MLADYEPHITSFNPDGRQMPDVTELRAVDSSVPEVIEANFELHPEIESKLKKIGATTIKPALYPAA